MPFRKTFINQISHDMLNWISCFSLDQYEHLVDLSVFMKMSNEKYQIYPLGSDKPIKRTWIGSIYILLEQNGKFKVHVEEFTYFSPTVFIGGQIVKWTKKP